MKKAFRCILFLGLSATMPSAFPAEATTPPNILVILADDLGYGDLSCHGGNIPTPNIDSIARDGMSFLDGYVTAPQCAPSRAGLMTGRYQQRFGFECNFEKADSSGDAVPGGGLAVEEKTIADRLRAFGYHTGAIGKWHLGDESAFHPLERGFDEFFGFLKGSSHYLLPGDRPIPGILRNRTPVQVTDYLTDVFGEEASAFIEKNHEKPWFLYLAFNAPHEPWEAPRKYLDRFPDISDAPLEYSGRGCPNARLYTAMVSALDDAVGGVLRTLENLHLDKQTVIVFLSDNGAPLCITQPASNGPLRGEKGDVLEGGVRVPFFIRWSGHIPAGREINAPVSTLDLLPTFLAMSGRPAPADGALDGQNLLPTLTTGKEPQEIRPLYWLFRLSEQEALHSWGIRLGPWKYWHGPARVPSRGKSSPHDMAHSPQTALFHIENDIHEDHDLGTEYPDKRKNLESKLAEWMQTLPPPKWGPSAGKQAPLTPKP